MSGPNSSPQDAVKATSNMTDSLRGYMDKARQDPAKELGITKEDLANRQKEASSPRSFVSDKTSRPFDVKSSARAQQIMNKGINKSQREKRQNEFRESMKILRKFQIVISIAGAMFVGWMGVEFLLPQYAAVKERNRLMQLRYDRAQAKLQEYALENPEGAAKLKPDAGVVIVTRPSTGNTIQ